jgi:hypothetical protein
MLRQIPTFLDFFAGSGLVSEGMKGIFRPVWANDICKKKAAVKGSSLRLIHKEIVYDFLDALLHLPVTLHLSFHPAYRAARRAISIHPK